MKFLLSLFMTLSIAIQGLQAKENIKEAYYAGGCFWGVEYYLEAKTGVKDVVSGFMGGFVKNPTYRQVVYSRTGHIETVKVTYDANVLSFKELTKLFFEIHDFTQVGGQGPDIGERYESYIFYNNEAEKQTTKELINILATKGYKVATKLKPSSKFYSADEYHQDYYVKHKKVPYCHAYKKIF